MIVDISSIGDLIALAREDIPYLLAEVERWKKVGGSERMNASKFAYDLERAEAEVERWKGLAVHHETVSDEARMNLLIERAKRDKAAAEVERLRAALVRAGNALGWIAACCSAGGIAINVANLNEAEVRHVLMTARKGRDDVVVALNEGGES